MPTSILGNVSPYEALFKIKLTYSALRIFGCLCYPWLKPYTHHKLDTKSIPCVFVDYSTSHHCYKCLDPKTSKIYLSRHVIFNENIFPFQRTETVPPPLPQDLVTHWIDHTPSPKPTLPTYNTTPTLLVDDQIPPVPSTSNPQPKSKPTSTQTSSSNAPFSSSSIPIISNASPSMPTHASDEGAPSNVEALKEQKWQAEMQEEFDALVQ
ncbi:hypothetical protein GH714_035192 [Hevea brasiliensis]|uniref:Retroviral polymerase SH3-like domain-containing protein n=1 Tax=Hevea brasiliensis TaxID=3981 RepID=A0A6A6K9A4_HEVBR|nr:hypothetical protein GH714_035192 [Hevea brasiliensis]